jgi:hypothetical protein
LKTLTIGIVPAGIGLCLDLEQSKHCGYSGAMTTPPTAKGKQLTPATTFMLVGGPKKMPLMLEQCGVRYATI